MPDHDTIIEEKLAKLIDKSVSFLCDWGTIRGVLSHDGWMWNIKAEGVSFEFSECDIYQVVQDEIFTYPQQMIKK